MNEWMDGWMDGWMKGIASKDTKTQVMVFSISSQQEILIKHGNGEKKSQGKALVSEDYQANEHTKGRKLNTVFIPIQHITEMN